MDETSHAEDSTLRVDESDIKNLTLLSKSDLAFAVMYGLLFVVGLILTIISV